MTKFMLLEIDNSKESAIKSGKWNAPGASFYDQLLNAAWCEGGVPDEANELINKMNSGKYKQWADFLEEAYLVAPVKKIQNSPHGVTPFSRSGCKYPHHVIRNGKLILSVPGIKAAYARALQMGVLKGEVKKHLERHIKELDMQVNFKNGSLSWNESHEIKIDENFADIEKFITERTGINLNLPGVFVEKVVSTKIASMPINRKTNADVRSIIDTLSDKEKKYIGDGEWSGTDITIYRDIIYKNGKAVAFLELYRFKEEPDTGYICVAISKEERGQGYARQLVNKVHSIYSLENDGLRYLGWLVDNDNNASITLANSLGFKIDSKQKSETIFKLKLETPKPRTESADNDKFPEVDVKSKKTTNPNDPESSKAVDLTFFDSSSGDKVGEASISSIDTDDAFLYNVEVFEKFRRKGYGNSIMVYCIENYQVAELTVEPDNDVAISLYKKFGFKKTRDWEENGKKYIVMRRDVGKSIQEQVEWIDRFVNDEAFRESVDIKNASDLMNFETPEDLLAWMDCIQYGWIDKSGKVQGTGDEDDEEEFYDQYRLQMPNELIKSKVGVCWDQAELERDWFNQMLDKYVYAFLYLELQDGESCPTHTCIIYKERGEAKEVYWFEHSWYNYRGIHKYKDLKTCIKDIVKKHRDASNDTESDVLLTRVGYPDKWSECKTCSEYMDHCRRGDKIDPDNADYEKIFRESHPAPRNFGILRGKNRAYDDTVPAGESRSFEDHSRELLKYMRESVEEEVPPNHQGYTLDTLPKIMYYGSRNRHPTVQNEKVFLTPYKGIASIFMIDTMKAIAEAYEKKTGKVPERISCNTGYREWTNMEGPDLVKPLKMVHIVHNIPDLTEVITGKSTGYIHCIDISDIRDELKTFDATNDPDREVIYAGGKPLKPVEIIEHTVKWEMRYDPEKEKHSGRGIVEAADGLLGGDEKWIMQYLAEEGETTEEPPPTLEDDVDQAPAEEVQDETAQEDIPAEEPAEESPPEIEEQPAEDGQSQEDQTEEAPPTEEDDTLNQPAEEEEQPPHEEEPEVGEDPTPPPPKKDSFPKKTDRQENDRNGVRRKKLYIAFIEWCKEYNSKNTFGSVFDKDIFHNTYPFVPEDMRYFYRLANPILCVLSGDLTFFQVSELRKLNAKNQKLNEMMIFAATQNDLRVFNISDRKVYRATEENGEIKLQEVLGDTFDIYLQNMINKGDILNGPIEDDKE